MVKRLFIYSQVTKLKLKNTNSKLKIRSLRVTNSIGKLYFSLSSYYLKVEKQKNSLRVSNLKIRLSFFHFRVTNSNFTNIELHFELLIRKMKEQNRGVEL